MNSSLYDTALDEMKKKSPDIEKVLTLLNNAKKEGDLRASYALGTWYIHGENVEKNMVKGIKYIQCAAEGNIPEALYTLAYAYETGDVVEQNERLAMENYLKAALLGDAQSIYEVGRGYYYGIGFNKDKKLADIWFDQAERLGITD